MTDKDEDFNEYHRGSPFKICGKCKQILLLENFYKHKRSGYQSYCIGCIRKYNKRKDEKNQIK